MPRKYRRGLVGRAPAIYASMRPGRMPRKYPELQLFVDGLEGASMRPGRMPRKYRGSPCPTVASQSCSFNEAGADAPEIP